MESGLPIDGELVCTNCGLARPRSAWSNLQWGQWSGGCMDAIGWCRVCRRHRNAEDVFGWTPTLTPRPSDEAPPRCTVPHRRQIPGETMRILGRSLCELRSSNIKAFISLWMHRVPHCRRKMLSFNGALLAKPGDPVHYQCPYTQAKYFDPGNAVYGLVVDVVYPEGCQE